MQQEGDARHCCGASECASPGDKIKEQIRRQRHDEAEASRMATERDRERDRNEQLRNRHVLARRLHESHDDDGARARSEIAMVAPRRPCSRVQSELHHREPRFPRRFQSGRRNNAGRKFRLCPGRPCRRCLSRLARANPEASPSGCRVAGPAHPELLAVSIHDRSRRAAPCCGRRRMRARIQHPGKDTRLPRPHEQQRPASTAAPSAARDPARPRRAATPTERISTVAAGKSALRQPYTSERSRSTSL